MTREEAERQWNVITNQNCAKWIINYLMPEAKKRKCHLKDLGIEPESLRILVKLTLGEVITSNQARKIIKDRLNGII